MSGYTKLFSSIIASTIWREDNDTRIVWITMLAMADRYGIVEASVPGLADMARVTVDGARRSILKLSSPDPDSRSHEYDGRRIEEVEGGWRILNHGRYREKLSEDDRREYQRKWQAQRRAKERAETDVDSGRQVVTKVDAVDTSRSRVHKQSTEAEAVPLAPLAVRAPGEKPLGYKPRIDVAWPGRPPVPGSLHAEFISKLGGDPEDARRRLQAWYPQVAAAYEGQPIGDDDFTFWRARFREWQGTTVKPLAAIGLPKPTDDEIWADIQAQKALRKVGRPSR